MAVTPPGAGSVGPVVQLTTLPGSRQFVTAVPSIPNLLAEPEWLSLDDGKRAAHDEERLDPVFAHGISLREPAGPADIDFEEVE